MKTLSLDITYDTDRVCCTGHNRSVAWCSTVGEYMEKFDRCLHADLTLNKEDAKDCHIVRVKVEK